MEKMIKGLVLSEMMVGRLYLDKDEVYTKNIFTETMKDFEKKSDKIKFKTILKESFEIEIV